MNFSLVQYFYEKICIKYTILSLLAMIVIKQIEAKVGSN